MKGIGIITAVAVCLLIVMVGCMMETPKLQPAPSQPAPTTTPPSTLPSSDERPPAGLLAITSVSPEFGPLEGGTVIQISGSNFNEGAAVYFIQRDTIREATNITVLSDTEIAARMPPGQVGFAHVRVSLPDGRIDTLENGITYIGLGEDNLKIPPAVATPLPVPESTSKQNTETELVEPVLLDTLRRNCQVTQGSGNFDQTGLVVGETAVNFTLKDTNGSELRLSQLLAEKPVMMVFGSFT